VEEKSQHQSPDFQKAPDRKPKQHRVASSHQRTEKTKTTVKNYQSLGYISYDATTSSWVTFSYELTGHGLGAQINHREFIGALAADKGQCAVRAE
jgi:hypothetical protein